MPAKRIKKAQCGSGPHLKTLPLWPHGIGVQHLKEGDVPSQSVAWPLRPWLSLAISASEKMTPGSTSPSLKVSIVAIWTQLFLDLETAPNPFGK